MKTKKILWSVASIAIVLVTAFNLNQSLLKQNSMLLSAIAVANLEALADDKKGGETSEKTDGETEEGEIKKYQVGTKTETRVSEPGWSYNEFTGKWSFNGVEQNRNPPTVTVTTKCCASPGPDLSCSYAACPF